MRGSTIMERSLQHSGAHAVGHGGGGVADIDLAAGDIEGAAVEGDGFGESGDGVFGGGVGGRKGRGTWAEMEPLLMMRPP